MSTQTNAPQTSEQDRKMTKGELISYGLGGMASTMPHQFRTSYAMNFLSDVAGLHVGAVGILSTIMLIWDASNDLIIGRIADCTNTKRFGKYRPHMIMGILLWAAVVIMLFSVPSLPETGMWIYYVLALFLYSTFYTQFTVPWQALNSVMTHDPQERNLMLTCRQYGGFIAGAAVGIITMPLVQHFADPKTGWLVSAGIVCVTMVITGLLSAHGARRVDYYNSLPTPEPLHIRGQLGIIFKNRAVICAALMPAYIWLATGGKTQLGDKLKVLTGREVIAFPDVDGYAVWKERLSMIQGVDIKVSDYLERNATEQDRQDHIDIADLLLRTATAQNPPAIPQSDTYPILKYFAPKHHKLLKEFIEELDLIPVSIRKIP